MKRSFPVAVLLLFVFLIFSAQGVLAAPVPSVALTMPATASIGEDITFSITFDNTGNPGTATDIGYGPFIDLFMPSNGADGAAGTDTPDGLSFQQATLLGGPVNATVLTFNDTDGAGPGTTGCVGHPYLKNPNGGRIDICGTAGDTLVVLELPFGSFTPEQPAAEIEVVARVSGFADLGFPLTVRARGGFRFGGTPVDDPCCDPPVVGAEDTGQVTPTIVSIEKDNDAPEYEVATGPNNPYTWTITVDIADGATLTDVDIVDTIPANVVVDPASVASIPPNNGVNLAGGQLSVNFATASDTGGAADITIAFDFTSLLDMHPNGQALAENTVLVRGDWQPADPRDGAGSDNGFDEYGCPNDECPGGAAPFLLPFAAQKTVNGNPAPGITLTYNVNFQVSDYSAFDNLLLVDDLPDGLEYVGGSAQLSFNQHNGAVNLVAVPMGAAAPAGNVLGPALLNFDLSAVIGQPALGGCIAPGGSATDCVAFNADTPTTGTLTYEAVVQQNFSAVGPGDTPSVDHGDVFENFAELSGDALNPANLAPIPGTTAVNDTSASAEVARGAPEKTIYATTQTGVTNLCPCTPGQLTLAPGDAVTYRIVQEMPISSYEDFAITDYVPLPVFRAAEIVTFTPTVDATVPAPGVAKFGPTDTLSAIAGAPAMQIDAIANTVTFNYADFDDPANSTTFIDLLFTVTMNDEPIADGLFVANMVETNEGSTNGGNDSSQDITQLTLTGPLLQISKGAVGSSAVNPTFLPAQVGPVVFNPPGSNPSFEPSITSNGLDANPVDSDLEGVAPGDLVTFAVIIENRGTSRKGAFDIRVRDAIPQGFQVPAAGLNFQARLGNGIPVNYLGTPGSFFTPTGIELVDPDVDNGVCGPYSGDSGTNIVVITYDLQLVSDPPATITNTSEVFNYGGGDGGGDHTGDQDPADSSSVFFGGGGDDGGGDDGGSNSGGGDDGSVSLRKAVDQPFAQPGALTTWTITVSNTQSTALNNFTLTDTLPPGLSLVSANASAGTVTTNNSGFTLLLDPFAAGDTVTVTVVTRVATSLNSFELVNAVTASTGAQASSTLLIAGTLPATGESRWSDIRRVLPLPMLMTSGVGGLPMQMALSPAR